MKRAEYFICEKCNASYNNADAAITCEKSHIKPEMIVNSIYKMKSFAASDKNYPTRLLVKMEDDTVLFYVVRKVWRDKLEDEE